MAILVGEIITKLKLHVPEATPRRKPRHWFISAPAIRNPIIIIGWIKDKAGRLFELHSLPTRTGNEEGLGITYILPS
jgi:hypothetical protein